MPGRDTAISIKVGHAMVAMSYAGRNLGVLMVPEILDARVRVARIRSVYHMKETLKTGSMDTLNQRLGLGHHKVHVSSRYCKRQRTTIKFRCKGQLVGNSRHYSTRSVAITRRIDDGILTFGGHTFTLTSRFLCCLHQQIV